MRLLRATCLLSCSASALLLMSSMTKAASMNWGDLSDAAGDVMFLQVSEQNTEPTLLFGQPTAVGNQLRFDPQNFQSASSGGASNLIDSTATTTIMANAGKSINTLQFTELGDYTLSGLNGGQAQATVGAAFFYTVLEVDGAPVTLQTETASLQITTGAGMFGGEYNRPGDDGTAVPWQGSVSIDLDAYLASQSLDGSVTKVRLRFDNTLSTAADAVSNAFIKKKEAGGVVITTNIPIDTNQIPEPTSGLMLLVACGVIATRRRR